MFDMKELTRRLQWIGCQMLVLAALVPLPSIAAGAPVYDVRVYGEYTCTESTVVVEVLVDINTSNILSSGVKLTYDPAQLKIENATKNEDVWYFGNDITRFAYVDPDSSVTGEVVLLGAKLDTNAPTEGVGGAGVLLGRITFARLSTSAPTLSLSLGKAGDYRNFVATNGDVLDDATPGVHFDPVTVVAPGDATGDGVVDGGDYTIWADHFGQSTTNGASDGDFNGDRTVDGADYTIWADGFGSNPCN